MFCVNVYNLIAAFSMASDPSGIGSSSARISSVLRGSIRIPLWSLMQAVTVVHSAFWDREPEHFIQINILCLLLNISSTTPPRHVCLYYTLDDNNIEFPELNLVKMVNFGELTCKAGQWTAVSFPCLIGNCENKN